MSSSGTKKRHRPHHDDSDDDVGSQDSIPVATCRDDGGIGVDELVDNDSDFLDDIVDELIEIDPGFLDDIDELIGPVVPLPHWIELQEDKLEKNDPDPFGPPADEDFNFTIKF